MTLLTALTAAVVGLVLAACTPAGSDDIPLGMPLRVGDTTYHATEARVVEWMPIESDHPDRDPELWRPATLYMRQHEFVPDALRDADLWVSVRLDIFSDEGPTVIAKDAATLVGGDGETYLAVFARDISRGADAPVRLPRVVAAASGDRLGATEAYPHGGPGSFAAVEAVFAVPEGATQGAKLLIAGPSGDGGTIDLGVMPVVVPDGAPQPHS